MNLDQYKKLNNVFAWLVFLVAATTYILTLEPTVSFWDCGEFISAAYKLQVVHQPGAPLFLMIVRMFTMLAGSDVTQVAYFANLSSGLASAFTILFLFWTITALAKKLINPENEFSKLNVFAIMSAGIVGSLAYTFSDTFWFSAVETEVYALSSLCTAIVFWAILKWEAVADEAYSDRWILFIAYVMGLSIGVHLLNLLAIPAIAFVYYFKKFEVSKKGIIVCAAVSVIILGFIQYGIIPGIVKLASVFELLFVNGMGLGFGSGATFFAVLLIAGIVYLIYYAHKKNNYILHLGALATVFVIIGYCSFAMIVIRAKANPNLNNSHPDNVFGVLNYLNREQYGDRPLLHGQYFNAKLIDDKKSGSIYVKGEKNYVKIGEKSKPVYEAKKQTIFPRIFSNEGNHVNFYRDWLNIPATKNPNFSDNISFFVNYQIGWMYLRYFMWNFVGRQNDVQGHGNSTDGNWISGITPLDNFRLGSSEHLSDSQKANKAYNKLYFLPLLLGFAGLIFQFNKDKKGGTVVAMLFFFTGLAIVLYLNQTPLQPRERDYAYAGSFYAFAIWIGLGVLWLWDLVKTKLSPGLALGLSFSICLLAVPVLMANQEWDDHDRSEKYTARDLAFNYLNSCEPNAILFTMGDNDTYPLWYAQEVEGFRTDVRVCNLSLLGIDWYINQMRKKMNDSEGMPFTIPQEKIRTGTRDYIPYYDGKIAGAIELREIIEFITSDNENAKLETRDGSSINYFPTKSFKVTSEDTTKQMVWEFPKNGIFKSDLMVLDLVSNLTYNRPIYFSVTMPSDAFVGLEDYFRTEGLAYKLTFDKAPVEDIAFSNKPNTESMYNNMMNKFSFGNMEKGIYIDPETFRMVSVLHSFYFQLANGLYAEGQKEKAFEVIEKMKGFTPKDYATMNYAIINFRIVNMYYDAKEVEKAKALTKEIIAYINNELVYFADLQKKTKGAQMQEVRTGIALLNELYKMALGNGEDQFAEEIEKSLSLLSNKLGIVNEEF
jgi:tetratricopeptide (TPR) repeat protein